MSLGRHSIANFLGTAAPLFVALFCIPVYLRYIGTERYGVLAVIMTLTGYVSFMDLGLGRAVTRQMASTENALPKEHSDMLWTALTASFLLGALGGVGLWFGADYLLTHVIDITTSRLDDAKDSVFWLGASLAFILPASALTGALHAKLRFIEVNLIQAFGGSAGLIVPLLVASLGYTELIYLVPSTLGMRVLTTVMLFAQCRKYVPLDGWPSIQQKIIKSLLHYGGWISIMSILAPLLVTIDRLVIATICGARSVTSYTIPYDLVSRTMIISGSFSNALFPRLAASRSNEGSALAAKASATLIAIMTPIVLAGLFLSGPFLGLWIGEGFAASSKGIAEAILVGVWVNAIVVPHHARYLATHSPKAIVIIYAIEIPLYFVMLWGGVSLFGAFGASLAWSARVFLDAILILKLNLALSRTLSRVFASSILLIVACCTLFFFQDNSALQFIIGSGLIIISIAKDRQTLNNAVRHIIVKKSFDPLT